MPKVVIKAHNISKKYRLGILNSGSLKQDLHAFWKKSFRPSVDPMAQDETNNPRHIWALKDINFEIEEGDVIGFVGNNGAGKSTILKILSRVTLPTTGVVKGNGRIASLLEVGTGFHPELTGRENIFLNGQILGMRKREIIKKFDEIVDFSGVEKFLDTPVKRYSTGMYMRLSFAVAAHMDPDILIIDEALAVGDAEFQSKCLGKMQEVSTTEGKTVLFVSHNMHVMRTLCNRAFCLEKGRIVDDGLPDKVIANYLSRENIQHLSQNYGEPESAPGNEFIRIKKVEIIPLSSDKTTINTATPLHIKFEYWQFIEPESEIMVGVHLYDFSGSCVFDLCSKGCNYGLGLINGECMIPANFLNHGSYYLSFDFIKNKTERIFFYEVCLSFDVQGSTEDLNWFGKWRGYVKPDFPISLKLESQ